MNNINYNNISEEEINTTSEEITETENQETTTPLLDVDGSVKTRHIEDGAVTKEKFGSDLCTYVDITDSLNITTGYHATDDGKLKETINAFTTGYINCKPGDKFRVSGSSMWDVTVVLYYQEKDTTPYATDFTTSVSNVSQPFNDREITIPDNCYYVVVQTHKSGVLKVEKNIINPADNLRPVSYWKTYDPNTFKTSFFYYINNNVLQTRTLNPYAQDIEKDKAYLDNWKTLRLPCKPNDKFIVSGFLPIFGSFRDTSIAIFLNNNDEYISDIDKGSTEKTVSKYCTMITAPENAASVVFNSYNTETGGIELYVSKYVNTYETEENTIEILKAQNNPLYGKRMYVDGDSIAEGIQGISYADIIAHRNNMNLVKKAVGGTTIAENDNIKNNKDHKSICGRVTSLRPDINEEDKFDFILLDGGGNDMFNFNRNDNQDIQPGTLTLGYDADFNTSETIGATEAMCKHLVEYYFDTPKLFVLTHRKLDKFSTQNEFWDGIKSALEKWGIPYVDLRKETTFTNWNDSYTQQWFKPQADDSSKGDGTHPNRLAYEKFYVPAIEAKLKTLSL